VTLDPLFVMPVRVGVMAAMLPNKPSFWPLIPAVN
jgi:hypothetical protein